MDMWKPSEASESAKDWLRMRHAERDDLLQRATATLPGLLRAMARDLEALTSQIVALGGEVPVQAILQIHRLLDLAEALGAGEAEGVREKSPS